VWLEQDRDAPEPVVVIDAAPSGSELTLDETRELRDALDGLLRAMDEP
jgi:hypothetical protein